LVVLSLREIGETQAAMKSVEESKSELLATTNELQLKLEASISLMQLLSVSWN